MRVAVAIEEATKSAPSKSFEAQIFNLGVTFFKRPT